MTRKNIKRSKWKLKKSGLLVVFLLIVLIGFVFLRMMVSTYNKIVYDKYYLASDKNMVTLYEYDSENEKMIDVLDIERGSEVESNKDTLVIDDKVYILVNIDDKEYYITGSDIVTNIKDIVLEDIKYVRTSVTVYKDNNSSKIASFIKKGEELEILDYDKILDDGNVNMYKIKKGDITGWVYQKYLVDTEAKALSNYNENGIYDIHKDRKYSRELYGGYAKNLDYYPYEKVEFSDNPLLKRAKAMYLNGSSKVINSIDEYLEIAVSNGVNAIVVDIKDGALAYPSDVAKEYSMTAYKTSMNKMDRYESAIKKIRDKGIYVIGRIVVFNDSHFGKDNPNECIKTGVSSRLWPSGYSRLAWEYNVELAKEAVSKFKFNEIQFDYVRFPEDATKMSESSMTDFRNKYNEEKAEAIQNFLFYATDELHKLGVYLSVDVFGECSSTYVTSYGQYWPAISNIVDVVSSMPYTDHFGRNVDTWSDPYETVNKWAKGAALRQKEIPTPAVARTWITAYDTPNWKPVVIYDASKISDQARALIDAGLDGGFITWNSTSSLNKYNQIKSAFAKNYWED